MHLAPRRSLGRQRPKFAALLALLLIISQTLSIAPKAGAAPIAGFATSAFQDTSSKGSEQPYLPLSAEEGALPADPELLFGDPQESQQQEIPLNPTVCPATLTGYSLSPTSNVPGGVISFTYNIQVSSAPLAVRLRSYIRSATSSWIPNSSDLRLVLTSTNSTIIDRYTLPANASFGTYSAAWMIVSDNGQTTYDGVVLCSAFTVGAATATRTPTRTGTPTSISMGTSGPSTATRTRTPSITNTATITSTPSRTATNSVTPVRTSTSIASNTPSTRTVTPTITRTATSSSTSTPSRTSTITVTSTRTPTITSTRTLTATSTRTNTSTSTRTPRGRTSTPTFTFTFTVTSTATRTPTRTLTPIVTNTPSHTQTRTATATATNTVTSIPTQMPIRTSTSTQTATQTFTLVPTHTSTTTRTNTPQATFTSTSTSTSTATNTATNTATITATLTNTATPSITPGGPTLTPTPSQPVLLAAIAAPSVAQPGSMLVLTYTIFSPSAQQVSLGAGLRVSGGSSGWFYDPANDLTVAVNPGINVVSRLFQLPGASGVTYDVIWGLWSAGFGTQYGLLQQDGAVSVVGPSPTPFAPTLVDVALEPSVAAVGSTIVLSYTVDSPVSQQVALGAAVAPDSTNDWVGDAANDTVVNLSPGTNVVSRLFNLGTLPVGSYRVRWGLWNANFSMQYGDEIRSSALTIVAGSGTLTPTPVASASATSVPSLTPTNTATSSPSATSTTPTATPGQPTLDAVSVAPTVTVPNGSVVLTYYVFSPAVQQVSLGAGVRVNGTINWTYDPANDRTLLINAGNNVVTRTFSMPDINNVTYDVIWGLWSGGFGTQYGSAVELNAVTVGGLTATPTPTSEPTSGPGGNTPTNTPTDTPTQITGTATSTPTRTATPPMPTLLGVSSAPASVYMGAFATLSYTIYSPAPAQYALGAVIRNVSDSYDDPGNNILVSVPAGTSVVTRPFYIRTDAHVGIYDVAYGLWNASFTAQYAYNQVNSSLTIVSATPTPSAVIPTYTPTMVATPQGPGIALGVAGPQGGQTVNSGSSINVTYTVINTTGSVAQVRLVARLAPSGMEGYGAIDDLTNQLTVNVPAGTSNVSRHFQLPLSVGAGSYDFTWTLTDPSNGDVLDTRTSMNHIWVNAVGQITNQLSIASGSLSTGSITMQNGVVNRVTGTFNINNGSGSTAKAVVRMRMKLHSGTTYFSDVMGDALVSVPAGGGAISRGFALPRYLPTGAYDVVWELGDANFNGTLDSLTTASVLQIVNSAPVANTGVPILMYHNINPSTAGGNWVSVSNFTQQMDYLVTNNWNTITGDELYNYIYRGTALPANPVWITFDDSYQNVYSYAYPIMHARGLRGSIFSVTQYMGQMNSWDICCEPQHLHMNWNMLQTMQNAGFAADSHTQRHIRPYDLSFSQLQPEIWGTQRDLISFLGTPASSFAYPYGQNPDSAKWLLAHSGFHAATIIGQTKQYTNYADMYRLTRIGIADSDNLASFITKITQP